MILYKMELIFCRISDETDPQFSAQRGVRGLTDRACEG